MTSSAASEKSRGDTLLLLPSPPSQSTRAALRAAYHEPLTLALSPATPSSHLTIAIVAQFLPINWSSLQSLLAGVYSLIATVQAESPELADVDATVIFVDHVPGRSYDGQSADPANNTTVPDLGTFASSRDRWKKIFHVSSGMGKETLTTFLQCCGVTRAPPDEALVALPGGSNLSAAESLRGPGDAGSQRFRTVVVAGTFDHLHVGHKLLLHASSLLLSLPDGASGDKPACLIIGVSGGALLKNKKFAAELESWPVRAQSVLDWASVVLGSPSSEQQRVMVGDIEEVHGHYCNDRILIRCVNIVDVYGPTITEENIDAIVVSAETRGGGAAVNAKRSEQGWKPLISYEIDVLNATPGEDGGRQVPDDFSAKISSTEIRRKRAEARAGSQQ